MRVLAVITALLLLTGTAATAAIATAAIAQNAQDRPAPELVGGPWLNTLGDKPVTLAALKGRVVVLHFLTFG